MVSHKKHCTSEIPWNELQKNYEMLIMNPKDFFFFKSFHLVKIPRNPVLDKIFGRLFEGFLFCFVLFILWSHLEGCMQFCSLSFQSNTLPTYPQAWAFPCALFLSSHQGCSCLSATIFLMHWATCLPGLFGNLYSALA